LSRPLPFTQKHDCESTNSGSGNELVKPNNFGFLKKRKEGSSGKE
jgi:hypothetical protein